MTQDVDPHKNSFHTIVDNELVQVYSGNPHNMQIEAELILSLNKNQISDMISCLTTVMGISNPNLESPSTDSQVKNRILKIDLAAAINGLQGHTLSGSIQDLLALNTLCRVVEHYIDTQDKLISSRTPRSYKKNAINTLVCSCQKCNEDILIDGFPFALTQMIVCQLCGNKRCPRATDHRYSCTASNQVGQIGTLGP